MTSTTAPSLGGLTLPFELSAALAGGPGAASATSKAGAATGTTTAAKAKAKTTTTAAKSTASKTTAKKASTTTAKKTTAAATGYATKLPADYAFLRDPKLSIEEKLSRFIGMLMTKSEKDLLAQMEKMAPGSTANAAGTAGAAGGASAPKPAAKKVSIWSLAKTILPPLGMASQLIGDANLKKLVQQVSGPLLTAAATALGGPALGALATRVGPALGELVTRDVKVDLSGVASLVGLGGGATAATGASTSTSTAGAATKAGTADGTSEKAQLMELQRLQDRDKEMFSLFSNMLKSMHDARMTAIQNLR